MNPAATASFQAPHAQPAICKKPHYERAFTESELAEARSTLDGWLVKARSEPGGKCAFFATLTPAMAAVLFTERNPDNRNFQTKEGKRYAEDIRRGAWMANGETIIIANTGEVNDGQHRIWGCWKSGLSIESAFSVGVSRDARMTVDEGRVRTLGNKFQMAGVKNSSSAAAVARLAYQLVEGTLGHGEKISQDILLDFYNQNSEKIQDAVRKGKVVYDNNAGLGVAPVAAAYFILSDIDKGKADLFYEKLSHGDGSRGPIVQLRKYLTARSRSRDNRGRITETHQIAMLIKTWNAKFCKSGDTYEWLADEPFPTPMRPA